ncbi:T9SS type A sorting domain-containing protein [Ferruginibacter sp.]
MKHVYKSCLAFLMAISTCVLILSSCHSNGEAMGEEEEDEYDGPDKAAQFEIERTKDLSTGRVPWEKLRIAIEQTEQSKSSSSNLINALSWIERGPNGDFAGPQGNGRQNNDQTGGRIRAAMVDLTDATQKTVWVGGVDGGLWKTTDITATPANWTLVNDFLANLAVAAICQDPRPGFQNIMYFCTGESYFNADAVRGVGVFKSIDGGNTWNFLSSTSTYLNGTRILCDFQGNVYLGTRGSGLLRSTDGGTSWTNITPSGLTSDICDLEISSTTAAGRLHVTTGIFSGSGYRYTDIPSTVTSAGWTSATTPFTTFSQRTEMAISGNTLYALPANASYQVPTIWKTTDGGANWASTTGQPASGWASGQGWYSLSAAINPANTNECIVGGLDCYKTSDGGSTWPKISAWVTGAGSSQYVHADQHNVQWWDGGTKLLFTNDGGAFFSSDGGTTIRDRNKGLRLKQFYALAIHPTNLNYFIGGAQDNGVHRLNHPGLDSSIEVYGGDGCFVAIDQNEPQYQFGSYVYNVYRRTTNNGASWTTPVNLGTSGTNGRFVNPFDYDNVGNKFYACYTSNNYLRWEDPQTGGTTTVVPLTALGGNISAVHVSPYTANRVYFGIGTGGIIKVDGADGATPVGTSINTGSGMPGGYVNCVVTGSDDQHIMATFTNYGVQNVWVTSNGGTSWTAVDGNLPDMPVRWALFHPDDDTKAFIATETGVWETDLLNGASTVWTANATFPNVRTDMIKYRASDRTIAAATHGRGIWSSTIPSGCTTATIGSQPSNATVCAGNNASFTITGTGTGYQWQESTNGGGSWGNITNGGIYGGATTLTLTLTGVTAGMNSYQYRCVATGSCAPTSATSNAGILTVNAATVVNTQPTNKTICAGATTTFSVAATGASLTYQWQESTNGGGSWNNITNGGVYSGATTVTLTLTGVTAGMNNNQYRCVIGSACSPLNSAAAILTVNTAPAVTAQPGNTSICAGNSASFSVTATGGGLTYQWQESTNGGGTWNNLTNVAPYSGVLTATLTINPTVVGMNTYQYRCIISGNCPSPATSNAATLTVGTALSITSQPASSVVCAGATTSFTVATSGTVISYQWQESTNGGGTWNNITNGGVYSGATTVTLTLTGVTAGMNNNQYRCVVTGSCPAINSAAAILTVNTAPNITAQPASSTICSAQNTSFSTTVTGTSLSYQWQVSTTGCGGPWTDIANGGVYAGATTNTLTITGAPTTMNGYAYHCVISGTCAPAATTSCATLTVNTPVAITAQPAASVVCAGATTTFGVTVTGTTPTYQWQESTNGGGTWNNITNGGIYSGATTATLTLTGVTAGMSSYQYRCIVTGATSCGVVNSAAALLTVNTAPAITTQPVAGTTICAGQNTAYTVGANGTALTYQWQVSTDGGANYSNLANGGVYSGVTTNTLSITAATVTMNTYRYRCIVSGTCTPSVTSTAAVLTVYTPVSITTAPANAVICATGTTSFSVVAAGTTPTYQWQESTNGGTSWNNITNGGIYSGATTTTLTLTGVTAGMNNYQYRTVVSGTAPCGAVNTAAGILTVSAQPTVTLTAAPYTKLLPGMTTTITASVNPPTGFTTVWTRNGAPINVTGNSVTVSVNELGLYTVVATIGSCISVPANITISDSASNKLFIYPSPNDGLFTVAYYNPGGGVTKQIVTVYSAKGERVYTNEFAVTQAYQLLKIDMRKDAAGVYYVVLSDANGNVIKRGEVLVR